MGTTADKLAYLQETKNDIISTLTDKLSGFITFDASKETFRNLCTKYVNAIGTTSIGDSAFYNWKGLTSVTIPNSVTDIGEYAFYGCTGLTSVTISNSVTSIGYIAFGSCPGITSIAVENGNPKYHSAGNCLIRTASGTLDLGCKTSAIPTDGSVTTIGTDAFHYCSGLTSITIPDSVTEIWDDAFYGCSGLTSVTIGNGVTSIGGEAFYRCAALSSVTIGNSIESIGGSAFEYCSGLTSITLTALIPPYLGIGVFTRTDNFQIYVPAESVDAYKSATGWSAYASRIHAIQ